MTLTTVYHEPLSGSEALSYDNLNAVFDDLDAAIVRLVVQGVAGEALDERDFVYLDEGDSQWYKIDTDATGDIAVGALRGCVAEVGGIASSGTGTIRIQGRVEGFSGLTPWGLVYGSTTAGGYTQTKPTVTDGGVQVAMVVMGVALSLTEILLIPQPVVYMKRETLADNGTLTIEHHSNARTRTRLVYAYLDDTQDEPLGIGSVSGDSEEVGVRFDDGAGLLQDTNTTFKNLTGGSADITCMVVMD